MEIINIDFILALLKAETGQDAIVIFPCSVAQGGSFTPLNESITAEGLAK